MEILTPYALKTICAQRINLELSYKRGNYTHTLEEAREILRKNLKAIFRERRFTDFWILDDRELAGVFFIKGDRSRGVLRIFPTLGERGVIDVEILPARAGDKLPRTLNEMTKRNQRRN